MQAPNPNELFQMTCDRIGLVCRTKIELYYFLATEGKLLFSVVANVYLPPVQTIGTSFLRQVMVCEKKASYPIAGYRMSDLCIALLFAIQ